MKAREEINVNFIIKDIMNGKYAPIYFLMGEEPYYIDLISDFIIDHVLNEIEKEFNLTVTYGAEIDIASVINLARRYPMMSDYQVIVVKEAQAIRNLDDLTYYLQNPLKSTILVFCYKNGVVDKRKKIVGEISRIGVLYESNKVKDHQIPLFITNYLKRKKVDIDSKAVSMLTDFVGSDLCRLASELDKLVITLPDNQTHITPDLVEHNIGVSKDYNNFELKGALIDRNLIKANQIVNYFNANPKNNPIQVTLSLLFNFFSNLMMAYYAPMKNEVGIAEFLGLKTSWQSKEYLMAMKNFSGVKTMAIINEIRYCDAMSKGVGNSNIENGDLLRQLVFFILH